MIFKDSAFSQELLKYFAETFQNAYWDKYTFQWHSSEIYGYFLSVDSNDFLKYTKQQGSRCYQQND